ncbi:hypothetical protein ACFQ48_16790 [Hymenobacter caeli]|uniref:Uncharacterized protein n=1 Tax=Hymenobacter caeli TaxID=2735894 RepID=A0ABX2FQB3_9BACT|nr:hypothetical protein [Hymenobacter caeli]NRT19363.1 hypothetical protein [Hymenobacter caeli]
MLSTVQPAAAPAVGAASQRLRETLARLEAALGRPVARSPAAPAVPASDSEGQAAYFELCRAQSAKYDADQAFWEVRDHYHGPGRKQRKSAARLVQEAARARFVAAAQAYHASPRGRAEAAARATHNARHGTSL